MNSFLPGDLIIRCGWDDRMCVVIAFTERDLKSSAGTVKEWSELSSEGELISDTAIFGLQPFVLAV